MIGLDEIDTFLPILEYFLDLKKIYKSKRNKITISRAWSSYEALLYRKRHNKLKNKKKESCALFYSQETRRISGDEEDYGLNFVAGSMSDFTSADTISRALTG